MPSTTMYKKFLRVLTGISLLCPMASVNAQHTVNDYPAGLPVNYVRTWDATAPIQDPNVLMTRPLQDVKMTTQYIDGQGRPIQTVIRQGSLATGQNPTDMVSPVEYDAFGREQYKWLPYADPTATNGVFKTNPFSTQQAFYSNPNGVLKGQGENYFYAQTQFEPNPLNRVQESFAPGVSWAGTAAQALEANRHSVKMKYWINTAADDVKMWTVTDVANSFGTYALSTINNGAGPGIYPAGQLYKNVSVDEHSKQVIEFKDKEGKVILKKVQLTAAADDGTGSNYTGWLCTYYIYDDLGNLRCVIQPEGVKTLSGNGWIMNYTAGGLADEQCFRYEYDNRNRMSIKKVPGAAAVYMVYDRRDRLVMTQDGNLFANGQWMVTLYDNLNRPIQTGLWTNSSTAATHATTAQNSPNYFYPFDVATVPASGWEKLSATHYDDYTGLPAPLTATLNNSWNSYFATASNTYPYYQSLTASTATKGLTTWTETKVLGTANTFITSVVIYDDKARPIQTQSINAIGGTDVTTTQYSWAGQPLITVQKTEKTGANAQTTVVVTQLSYDDLGRVTKTEKKLSNTLVNGNAMPAYKTIAENKYDALGRLTKKALAPQYNNNAGLESLNYDYNIRGWLLGANRDYVKDVNPSQNASTGNGYFGFDLGYDKANNNIINNQTYNNPQYNGNIEGMVWKSKGDGEKRRYDFTYDAANRLLKADFTQYTSINNIFSFNQTAGVDFTVKMGDGIDVNSAYDANGNIKRMQQWGLKINASAQIDNLLYQYKPSSNRLAKVDDSGIPTTDNGKLGDFKDGTNTNDDYSYDVNGNMNQDYNKAISSITYNHLNLPQTITVTGKGTITYTYDAGGNKLQKQTVDNSTAGKTITTTTKYASGLVYESKTTSPADVNNPDYTDVLQFLPQEEGRIRPTYNGQLITGFAYDYMLKDHLGNVRMVLTEEQQQNKYPIASLENTKLATEKGYYDINETYIRKTDINPLPGLITYNNNYNGIGNNPTDVTFEQANSKNLYRINGNENKTGLGITLRVMAGDKVNIFGNSYYSSAVVNNGTCTGCTLTAQNLVASFLNAPNAAATSSAHGAVTTATVEAQAGANISNILQNAQNNQAASHTDRPRAFINYILFDEQFKYAGGGTSIVGAAGDFTKHQNDPQLKDIEVPKNGYIYVYCSNESNVDVFFDNLQVVHTRGAILEETHYYPFGLTMAGISSKSAGGIENKKKFNGIEYENSFELNIGEAFFRTHDPQLGRWWQIDPKAINYNNYSVYCAMGNNPILIPDALGDEIVIPYSETVTDKKGKTKIVQKTFVWEPGKKYTGKDEGVVAAVAALEKIYEKKDELNIKYSDDNGKEVSGNVLTDFLKGGKFEKVKATIFPDLVYHNKSNNKKSVGLGIDIIWFNYKEGNNLLAYKEQAAGKQAPFFALLHEFGHLWLNNVARNRMEVAVYWPNNTRNNSVEEQLIFDKVQNKKIADAYGQPQQIYYYQSQYGRRKGPLSNE